MLKHQLLLNEAVLPFFSARIPKQYLNYDNVVIYFLKLHRIAFLIIFKPYYVRKLKTNKKPFFLPSFHVDRSHDSLIWRHFLAERTHLLVMMSHQKKAR